MNQAYVYAKIQKMVSIEESIYKNLARLLISEVEGSEYYNGSVKFETEEHSFKLISTLMIYRSKDCDSSVRSGVDASIKEISPVWWECQSEDRYGAVLNDFCWEEFQKFFY